MMDIDARNGNSLILWEVGFLIVALEMNAYDRNILTRMLWDLDQSRMR